ncbi:hypothetical protein HY839_01070 [Candidatus Azambacteria bacterium]|nr:hypothetical protein [Candidatus Azambacteria bacterium]
MTCQKRCCVNAANRTVKKVLCIIVVIAALVWVDTNFNIIASSQANKQARAHLQAVFLSNGQVYFGALSRHGIGFWRLDRAHYLQVSKTPSALSPETPDGTAPQETRTTLMKLSDDMHRPQNTLFIPASQILFWQNLQNDSPVAQAIISGQ